MEDERLPPFDDNSTASPPMSTDDNGVSDQEKRSIKRWAKIRRSERRAATVLALCILTLTAAAVGLDLWRLSRVRLQPYALEALHNLEVTTDVRYSLAVRWESNGQQGALRPRLFLDGSQEIPEAGSHPPLTLTIAKREVFIELPQGLPAGTYSGEMLFTNTGGPAHLAKHMAIPIVIDISGRWLDNWYTVSMWGAILAVGYLLLYLAGLILAPMPRGTLILHYPEGGQQKIPLKPRFVSWLFPWKRHAFPLSWIEKKLRGKSVRIKLNLDGSLYFHVSGMAPVFEIPPTPKLTFQRTSKHQYEDFEDLLASSATTMVIRGAALLAESDLLICCDRQGERLFGIRYTKKPG